MTSTRRTLTRWRGLRGRATIAFAGLTLLLSTVMAAAVWVSVSSYLLSQREAAATAQAVGNADQVRRALRGSGVSTPQVLAQLPRQIGSTSLVRLGGEWQTTSLDIGRDDVPPALTQAAAAGRPSHQRIEVGGEKALAVGLPLAGLGDAYLEVFPLEELDGTYRALSGVLTGLAVAVPLGSLLLGWHVLRPALRPLERVATAAQAMAAGDLRARLDPSGDPELAAIATSFNRTAEALERRVRGDARFAADVSHELRSPLTTMVSAAALADAYRDSLPAAGQEALTLLREEVDRFQRLVEDLLEMSRADAGSVDLSLEDLPVAEVVRHAVPAESRDRVAVAAAAQTALVRLDRRRMERVISNLVDNAERHGGGLVAVEVDEAPAAPGAAGPDVGPGTAVRVSVEDAGPGLDEEDRERIFDRFARGRRSPRDSTYGAGLGLSLVARHVHAVGGTVVAENRPQGGARFVVTLPTVEATTEPAVPHPPAGREEPPCHG